MDWNDKLFHAFIVVAIFTLISLVLIAAVLVVNELPGGSALIEKILNDIMLNQ